MRAVAGAFSDEVHTGSSKKMRPKETLELRPDSVGPERSSIVRRLSLAPSRNPCFLEAHISRAGPHASCVPCAAHVQNDGERYMQDGQVEAREVPDLHRRQMVRRQLRQDVPDVQSLYGRALGARSPIAMPATSNALSMPPTAPSKPALGPP